MLWVPLDLLFGSSCGRFWTCRVDVLSVCLRVVSTSVLCFVSILVCVFMVMCSCDWTCCTCVCATWRVCFFFCSTVMSLVLFSILSVKVDVCWIAVCVSVCCVVCSLVNVVSVACIFVSKRFIFVCALGMVCCCVFSVVMSSVCVFVSVL